jgi:hypothetical protein
LTCSWAQHTTPTSGYHLAEGCPGHLAHLGHPVTPQGYSALASLLPLHRNRERERRACAYLARHPDLAAVGSTNFRHKVSPSPVLSAFLSAVPTWRNSSKTASWSSGAMQTSVSVTDISTNPSFGSAATSIRPPSGVNLIAFDVQMLFTHAPASLPDHDISPDDSRHAVCHLDAAIDTRSNENVLSPPRRGNLPTVASRRYSSADAGGNPDVRDWSCRRFARVMTSLAPADPTRCYSSRRVRSPPAHDPAPCVLP